MLEILHLSDLPATSWKNGGGVTREVVRREDGGRLIWRISVANVDEHGPFSQFARLTRILTVIEGGGIDLISSEGVRRADWGQPLWFSGNLPVQGRLCKGPIRDLNLIYDSTLVQADVQLMIGPQNISAALGLTGCLVLTGCARVDGTALQPDFFAFGSAGQIELDPDSKVLLVTINDLK